jgi:SAM-dependent methyltransferase
MADRGPRVGEAGMSGVESSALFAALQDLVACPRCASPLTFDPPDLRCVACGACYPQRRADCLDLMPREVASEGDWAARQQEMEQWYVEMADTDWSRACFTNDYGPFASILGSYAGTVLDLGGGAGVTRQYLPAGTRYVVVDPSLMWLGTQWAMLADEFPCLATPPAFVRGIGEALPVRSRAFDVVLAFWALNHASDPTRIFQQVARALRPGGRFLVVLEDMEPRWPDVVRPAMRRRGMAATFALASQKLAASLPGRAWPLQDDHIRIRERDVRRWSAHGLEVVRREWIGNYLTYELVARQGHP